MSEAWYSGQWWLSSKFTEFLFLTLTRGSERLERDLSALANSNPCLKRACLLLLLKCQIADHLCSVCLCHGGVCLPPLAFSAAGQTGGAEILAGASSMAFPPCVNYLQLLSSAAASGSSAVLNNNKQDVVGVPFWNKWWEIVWLWRLA